MNIKNRIDEIYDEMVELRRYFHQNPELSNQEYNTQKKIQDFLTNHHIENEKIASTGVVGLIGTTGKTVGLRADIDALPIQESNDVPYASIHSGVMHACGHDVHTTILLGTAKLLKELSHKLNGQVKLMFQPAEETTGGALPMIQEGILENPKVDYVLGLHVMPYLESGTIELKHGQLNAASDMITITIKGKKGHGAYPELSIDAISAAAHVITALQTLVSRNISPLNACVLSIGSINGGLKGNIICDEVVLQGTLRTLDPKTRVYAKERIHEIIKHQTHSFGADFELDFEEGYEPLINNNAMIDFIKKTAEEVIGEEHIVMKSSPSLGVEDFAYFSNRVKGAFYHLGCKKSDNLSLHQNNFDINESCIKTGILMQVELVLKLLK